MNRGMSVESIGMIPHSVDKRGPLYTKESCDKAVVSLIKSEVYFENKAVNMTNDTQRAIDKTVKITGEFEAVIERFLAVECNFEEKSKKASGNIKSSAERLAQGLARIEKAANFDRMERYVILLERASTAMAALADLESSGKLERIAAAIR